MLPKRLEKLKTIALKRQLNITVILENIRDTHNIGAVMRTCDSIGIREIYAVYSDPEINLKRMKLGKRTSSGSRKWVRVFLYNELAPCIEAVRKKYDRILCTHLASDAQSLYDLELTGSIALVFGNERRGISDELLALSDGNFIVPQMGMVQSLNISVACAITLYECFRQRQAKGLYEENTTGSAEDFQTVIDEYIDISANKLTGKHAKKVDRLFPEAEK